jgi:hypothetical protein
MRWKRRAGAFAALTETVIFLNHFKDLPDPRQPGKVIYPLDEVLVLCLLAVLAGTESFVDIALLARRNSIFRGAFDRSVMRPPRAISWGMFLPASTPLSFSSASCAGWHC